MKVALITDQHFGGKQDSQYFTDYIVKFYTNQFFPYLKENCISHVIDLGDTFDRRKYVNFNTLNEIKKYYFDVLQKHNIILYSIVGNHSTYYRNTNSVNSSNLLYGHYDNVKTFDSPAEINFKDLNVDIIPWINSENYDDTMEFIKNSKNQVLFGHLEVAGFAMYKGYNAEDGLSKNIFKGYEVVCSGHYHHKSSQENIHYLGAPYEITWNDFDDIKGFHTFDTKTRELEFIPNQYRLFEKIYYDDSKNIDYKNLDTDYYKDKIVKLIVETKTNLVDFEDFVERLYKSGLNDLTILEDLSEYSMRYGDDTEEDLEVGNTSTFLNEYVDAIKDVGDVERNKIKKLLQVIHGEALNMDE